MQDSERKKSFYPDYLFEVTLTICLTLEVLFVLAVLYPKGIGRIINFTSPYQPRPEWYFLWLYQLVRYFHGPFVFLGTVVVPLTGLMVLLFLPWIDKRFGRIVSLSLSLALFLGFLVLTLLAALG